MFDIRTDLAPLLPLALPGDRPVDAPTLGQNLALWAGRDKERRALAALVARLAAASLPLADRLRQGRLPGAPDAMVGTNSSGDRQKALDRAAHAHFLAALSGSAVASLLSEEAPEPIALDPHGLFDVALDPVDGSGSIGIGAPLGTLFCIFPAGSGFRATGRAILAAGYIAFGPSVDLGFSLGDGVTLATLDPTTRTFRIEATRVAIPPETATIAFNLAHRRHWSPALRAYADDILAGPDGPRGRAFNMRWLAAAVGDLNRILRQGGLFMYPADTRPGHAQGFLRLAYEAFPIAFLTEQAGGRASDGTRAILDLAPAAPHARVPLVFGSRAEVAALEAYLA